MTIATAHDMIKLASKMAGVLAVGQTPVDEDANDILDVLNLLLSSWSQDRWMVYRLKDIACRSTASQSYSIGPNGDFNTSRPDILQSAYARLLNGNSQSTGSVDFPLFQINTYEEYGNISLKYLESFPVTYFYDPTLTLGTLHFYPIPNENFELHIIIKDVLPQFERLNDVINLPPEYYSALLYNLALRIQMLFGVPLTSGLALEAKRSMNIITVANTRVPMLKMPFGLIRRNSAWNPNSVGGVQEGVFTLDEDLLG